MSVVSFWDFMKLWVRKFKFMTISVSTSWLYVDKSYVLKQFLYKEASETHIFIFQEKEKKEQNLVLN